MPNRYKAYLSDRPALPDWCPFCDTSGQVQYSGVLGTGNNTRYYHRAFCHHCRAIWFNTYSLRGDEFALVDCNPDVRPDIDVGGLLLGLLPEGFAERDRPTWAEFKQTMRTKTEVWTSFRNEVVKGFKAGMTEFSSRAIIHYLRWHSEVHEGRPFKVRDHVAAYLGRLMQYAFPAFAGKFKQTHIPGDGDDEPPWLGPSICWFERW